jgi:hypothetical protein
MQTVHVKKPLTGHAAGTRREEQAETAEFGQAFTLTASQVYVEQGQGSNNSGEGQQEKEFSSDPTIQYYGSADTKVGSTADLAIESAAIRSDEIVSYAFSEDDSPEIAETIEATLVDQFEDAQEVQNYEMLINAYYQKIA